MNTTDRSILWQLSCERSAGRKLLNAAVLIFIANLFADGSIGWWIHILIASFEVLLLLAEAPLRRLAPLSRRSPFP